MLVIDSTKSGIFVAFDREVSNFLQRSASELHEYVFMVRNVTELL